MGDDTGPRDYDREYTKAISPGVRSRIGFCTDRGAITRFVVQLEYRHERGWEPVVRFDRDPETEHGHDVAEEGVHVDIYRDGEKWTTEIVFPPMTAASALTHAEDHLSMHHERYVERYETWHRKDRKTE